MHFFISYAKVDTFELAEKLYRELNALDGISAWMDASLQPASSWALQIQDEIDRCDYMLVLLSPDLNRKPTATQRRSFVLNEIDYAQQIHTPIIPIMAQPTRMPVQIVGIQYIDFANNFDMGMQSLLREIDQKMGQGILGKDSRSASLENVPLTIKSSPYPTTVSFPLRTVIMMATSAIIVIIAFMSLIPIIVPQTLTATPSPTLSPFDLTKTPVTSNADWTPYEETVDGVTMLLVPEGCFMMGSNNGDDDEQPVREECIEEPFWIDKYEVTNEKYDSIGCEDWSSASNQPRNCVTWFEAKDLCEARGGRLPTEREWEYAARGPDNFIYPWGNEWNDNNTIFIGNSGGQTAIVGSRSTESASWIGVIDLAGNVWEWTSSLYSDYPYDESREDANNKTDLRVVRGGSFSNTMDNLRSAFRYSGNPSIAVHDIGFRCARS